MSEILDRAYIARARFEYYHKWSSKIFDPPSLARRIETLSYPSLEVVDSAEAYLRHFDLDRSTCPPIPDSR